jgi:hypothetical protein
MTMRMAALPLLLALSACVPVVDPGPVTPGLPPDDACGAPGLQGLIGQDRRVLASMTFPTPTRVIEPGMAVTMDYNPARLNIELDDAGRIIRVTCG